MKRYLAPAAAGAVLLCLPGASPAQTVVARQHLGNNVEGLTWVPSGDDGGTWAALDGWDVVAIAPRRGHGGEDERARDPVARRLFNVAAVTPQYAAPRGLCYEPAGRRYYFTAPAYSTAPRAISQHQLVVTDARGNGLPPLALTFLPETDAGGMLQYEGCAALPGSAFADKKPRLAVVTIGSDFVGHIQLVRLDGVVERELVPGGALTDAYLTAVGFSRGQLLLAAATNEIYALSLATGEVAGPVATLPALDLNFDLEGLAVDGNGQLAAAEYGGRLYLFDAATYGRRTADDRDFHQEPRINRPSSVSYDADAGHFYFGGAMLPAAATTGIAATSDDFTQSGLTVNIPQTGFAPRGASYVFAHYSLAAAVTGGAQRGVVYFAAQGGRYFFRDAPPVGRTDWFPIAVAPGGPVVGPMVVRLRGSDTLALTGGGASIPGTTPPSRTSVVLADLPLGPGNPEGLLGRGLSFYDDGAGGQYVVGANFYRTDGAFVRGLSPLSVGLGQIDSITPITAGRWAGSFAILSSDESTVVIATLP